MEWSRPRAVGEVVWDPADQGVKSAHSIAIPTVETRAQGTSIKCPFSTGIIVKIE